MKDRGEMQSKPVGTREWYDFVGQLADGFQAVDMGGMGATDSLLELCGIEPSSTHPLTFAYTSSRVPLAST